MKTRKLRRTGAPCRYGTLEVATGDVVDVPAGVAVQLADADEGWEFASADVQTSAPAADAPTVSRRKTSGESDS